MGVETSRTKAKTDFRRLMPLEVSERRPGKAGICTSAAEDPASEDLASVPPLINQNSNT